MMKYFKRFVRWLYWKFGFNGDQWQQRMVCYYVGNIITCTEQSQSRGDFVLAQINDKMEKIAEVSYTDAKSWKFKDLNLE